MKTEFGRIINPDDIFPEYKTSPKITCPDLYRLIAGYFPANDPIHEKFDFISRIVYFDEKNPSGTTKIQPRLTLANTPEAESTEVTRRLDMICRILSALSQNQPNGQPTHSLSQVYEAYSVIGANWLSIHGCLGTDGHGRTLIHLLPITLNIAGYPHEFDPGQFQNQGEFNIYKSFIAAMWLNMHQSAGLRLLAARTQLRLQSFVHPILRHPQIIYDRKLKKYANAASGRYLSELVRTKGWRAIL